MTKRHRSALQQRLHGLKTAERAWELYAERGRSQPQIAAELGISQGAVSKALKRAEREALAHLRNKVTVHKMRQLARLEYIYRCSLEGFERSIGERVRTVTRAKTEGGDVTERRAEVHRVEHAGDPQWLREALRALAAQRRLLGLDAPAKLQAAVEVEHHRPYEHWTEDELRHELAKELEKAGIDPPTLTPASKSVN
jgi:predicted transcriptional regulator